MGATQMANKMQIRRDSATNWTGTNPTLSQGEMGYELNTGKLKIGNGVDAWVDLDYFDDQNGSYNDLRDLPFSDPPNVSDIANAASKTYVNNAITALKAGAGSALDTLNELATALGNDANFSATVTSQLALKANSSSLSVVATSGAYADLSGKPTLFDGVYGSLTGKPTLFNGDYNNLSNKPTLFNGDYDDLTHKPTLFSGDYDDLTSKPTLFNGDYDDLTSKPTLFNGVYSSLTGRPTLATVSATGEYTDLLNKPSLSTVATSGSYTDLTNKPSLFSGSYTDLTNKPTLVTSYNDLTDKPSLSIVATSGSYTDLTSRPTLATVATSGAYADLSGVPRIPVYVDNTARDAAIPSPAQGMMVLTNSILQVWNGSLWLDV
jgi:hypothetical protein